MINGGRLPFRAAPRPKESPAVNRARLIAQLRHGLSARQLTELAAGQHTCEYGGPHSFP